MNWWNFLISSWRWLKHSDLPNAARVTVLLEVHRNCCGIAFLQPIKLANSVAARRFVALTTNAGDRFSNWVSFFSTDTCIHVYDFIAHTVWMTDCSAFSLVYDFELNFLVIIPKIDNCLARVSIYYRAKNNNIRIRLIGEKCTETIFPVYWMICWLTQSNCNAVFLATDILTARIQSVCEK